MESTRTYQEILDEVVTVKLRRQERLRELLPNPEDFDDPRRVRLETLKAQNHDDVLEMDLQLQDLRAEQQAHPGHGTYAALWGKSDFAPEEVSN